MSRVCMMLVRIVGVVVFSGFSGGSGCCRCLFSRCGMLVVLVYGSLLVSN